MSPEEKHIPQEPAAEALGTRLRDSFSRRMRTSLRFGIELMREHEFWVHALAVKGGASAIVIAAVVGLSYVIAAPFMLAATGIAACGALIGLGVYGVAAGSVRSWMRLRKIHAQVTGKPLPPLRSDDKPGWLARQKARPSVQRFLNSRPVQGFLKSRAWQMTKKYTEGQQDNVLGGIAVGGAAVSLVLGAVALATQMLVLPVVALGGLVTVAAVTAVTYVVSGISGLYFGITGIRHMKQKKREKMAAQAAAGAEKNALPAPEAASPDTKKKATADFSKAGLTAQNDNAADTKGEQAPAAAQKTSVPKAPKG